LLLAVGCIIGGLTGVVSLRRMNAWAKANKAKNGEEGWAIIWSVANRPGNVARVEELLSQKPDLINIRDAIGGGSLLSEAAMGGYVAMGEMLLRRGADLGAVNDVGMAAIHEAAWWGQSAFVRFLVEHGDDVDRPTKGMPMREALGEMRAIHFALMGDHTDTAEVLVKLGTRMTYEYTTIGAPEDEAVRAGALKSVKWVVTHPEFYKDPDRVFGDMLSYARTCGRTNIVRFLESKGVKEK